jgi:signal transduction histidine kinase
MLKKGVPQRTSLDVNIIVREVIELVQGELQTRRISLRTELADNLPGVSGDPIQLSQVILNLIINVAESAPRRAHKGS